MQVVFHIGSHMTDSEKVLKTLLSNRDELLKLGTEPIPNSRHKGIFVDALASLKGGAATPEMEQILLDAVTESDDPQRIIFSMAGFLGVPKVAVTPRGFFADVETRLNGLMRLYPSSETEFFMAIRNPATMLNDIVIQDPNINHDTYFGSIDPRELRWRDVAQRMARAAQGRRIVMWCYEDLPMIFPEVLRMIGNMPLDARLTGGQQYVDESLTPEGREKLKEAMRGYGHASIGKRRELHGEMLRQYGLEGRFDQAITLPGWTQKLVDEISDNYYSDVAEIAVLPGIEFILP